ncbi:MAG: hypothetical protein HY841_09265 [Bacteroidetes bacterium]|nr:hypothetical protein [Bacteroidota bacterium]
MIFRKFSFLIIVLFSLNAFSQISTTSDTSQLDTLFFLNGEVRAVKVVDTVYHLVRFLPEKRTRKPHVQDVEKDRIFSLKFSNGQERIVYFHDSTIGNVFTVLEAKMFMLGEREADQHYKNKWPFIFGFVVGAGSPIALSNAVLLSPIAPAVTPLHTLIPVIKIDTAKIENKNYLQYDTYLMGYEKVARKKNFMHSLIGAGIGLAVGLGVWAVPDKTWMSIGDKTWEMIGGKNFRYIVCGWSAEIGFEIGYGVWNHKKHKKNKK